jgi:hypothetical protein
MNVEPHCSEDLEELLERSSQERNARQRRRWGGELTLSFRIGVKM